MPTGLSLFSGMGGDTHGMVLAGVNVIGFSEIQKRMIETHIANFKNCALLRDHHETNISKISDATLQQYKVNIVFAGFPCQGFSNAGKKLTNDPRNVLFKEFIRVVRITEPRLLIGENVKGLLSRKQDGVPYINLIESELKQLGYNVRHSVLRASDYGVPQLRDRLFIIGVKNGESKLSAIQLLQIGLRDIIVDSMCGAAEVVQDVFTGIPECCIIHSTYAPSGKIHPFLKLKIDGVKTIDGKTTQLFSFGKRRTHKHCEIVDIRNPAKTIICSYHYAPRLFIPMRYDGKCFLRPFLPVELKQIQGFPSDFIVEGSIKEQIIQIGNAVPPKLVQSIIEANV